MSATDEMKTTPDVGDYVHDMVLNSRRIERIVAVRPDGQTAVELEGGINATIDWHEDYGYYTTSEWCKCQH